MQRSELQDLLTKPPASFVWAEKEDGSRLIGTSEGAVVDIWPDRIEFAGAFPPDNAALAARNGILIVLLLTALRLDWPSAGDWLAAQMKHAANYQPLPEQPLYDVLNYARQVRFTFDKRSSRATLWAKNDGRDDQSGA